MEITNSPKLSILIPVHNEEGCVEPTVRGIEQELERQTIPYEILVVNDGSTDGTEEILQGLCSKSTMIRYVNNPGPHGFGLAIRFGLEHFRGDAVAIVMGDGSDDPKDIVRYYEKLKEGHECVFGSRFIKGSRLNDYPWHKLILNRMANYFIKIIFRLNVNDVTNAFKCYRREVIDGIRPILSHHFNLTVELPLKAIVRGYSYAVIPISWTNRATGVSKLKIKEMGSRYLFIVLYILLEKVLSRGDYYRKDNSSPKPPSPAAGGVGEDLEVVKNVP